MATINKGILILTPFFSPNIGGVETHLDDLVRKLNELRYKVYIHSYSPITTPNVKWQAREKIGKNILINRYSWFGKDLFHKIEKYPFFDFIYLTPYLLLRTFLWMIYNHRNIDIIHAQGLNASLIGYILKSIFHKKLVSSIHAIYETNIHSTTAKLIAKILNKSDHILTLSKASEKELLSFGVSRHKLHVYKYWIQTDKFYSLNKNEIRKKLNFENKFTVIFVGRLIRKKGVRLLVKVAQNLPNINFIFIGTGPESEFLNEQNKFPNIKYLGKVPNCELINYYNLADIFCIPSLYEEGFGRVVMEAVACGLPVVGSNFGGIKEALDDSVSILTTPTYINIKKSIETLYRDNQLFKKLQVNTIPFSRKHFSDKNIQLITKYY